MPRHTKTNEELESYKDAVWDYMLEHCDVTESGSFFVKFHTTGRLAFERHIKGRWKYNYHRKDDRSNFTHKQKELDATARKQAHKSRKEYKQRKYQEEKKQRLEEKRIAAMTPLKRFIHKMYMQPLVQKCYNKVTYYVKIAKDKK